MPPPKAQVFIEFKDASNIAFLRRACLSNLAAALDQVEEFERDGMLAEAAAMRVYMRVFLDQFQQIMDE